MGMTTDGLSYWQAEVEGFELLEMTIGDLLDRRADELPTQEAIVYSCYPEFGVALNIRWTYQDYRDQAKAVAKGLLALGLKKGDHIAAWAANIPEWPILMMAAAKVGLVLVTINPVLQPAEVEYILKQGDVQALFFMARVRTYDHLATIVTCGAVPVRVSLMEQVKARIGADVGIVFGQTESSCCLTCTLPDDPFELKATTVGKPLPYIDAKIVDPETGKLVPAGERGELCYRGFVAMQGYYKMPERAAETIDSDGWVHSGDLATMNAQGYLNIVGRIKDMVIRGAENLFPREIEEVLIRHPKVADVQVLGVPDTFFGEELLAVVLPKTGMQLTEQDLREYCTGRISHQKIPRYFQFVDAFPMTASGKVQKFVLREQALA